MGPSSINEIPQAFCQSEKFGYLNSLIGRSAFKFQQFHAKVWKMLHNIRFDDIHRFNLQCLIGI